MRVFTIVGGSFGVGKTSFAGVLTSGDESIFETTFSGDDVDLVKQAKEVGNYVRLEYIALDTVTECLARIANRVKRGGRNVPDEDVLRSFEHRWEYLAKVLPFCDETTFIDNDNGFVKVAEYHDGNFIVVGNKQPEWVRELQNYLKQAKTRNKESE